MNAYPSNFKNPGKAGPPRLSALLKSINVWTVSWLLISSLITFAYGYYFQLEELAHLSLFGWMTTLVSEFSLVAAILGIIMLYIHDRSQKDDPIQRVFPVVIWGRKFLISLGPLLRQYIFSNDQEELPYNRITRKWIYESSRGARNTIGFGTQLDMDKVGSYLIMPATFTNKKSKTGEEVGHSYKKVIGAHTGVQPVTLTHFVNISAMSFGALSGRAHEALNLGAKMAGILHNCGEGGLAPCHEKGGDLIFQIGTAKYGVRDENGNLDTSLLAELAQHPQIKMFEVKLAQGAKPGKGGMLLKEKITPEIARIRKIPMGKDAYAPARHQEFSDVDGLFDFIDTVRKTTQKPVGIKMVIGHTSEIEDIAEKMSREPGRGPDYIAIDGGEGGTGASPLVLSSYAGLPMKQAVAVADWALKRHKVRDKVVIFASGKISTPIEIAVAMALGADAVYIARGFMFSLGCIQALECHTNTCPSGIATQDKRLEKALNVEAAAQRIATYAKTLYTETQMLAEACGYDNPNQITADDIMVVTSPGHLDYLSELHGISAYEASLERQRARKMGMTVGEMKIYESDQHK
ncbi:FMN-binding glutamate synthase family protein [Cytophagales bacterium LB-30]|uniref:FMN-binding glutamate synthase family protein n=1 Tax=Shiella aurantiaca TaxID=3058365 RepID=A0ABT8F502_9BACT|nr:FMN-binding glutamate synthase family protein [Shiella aurantiaca]MDN4165525.1 FMN-binding glutamate synthase family protein [Shiella aurantiaca]